MSRPIIDPIDQEITFLADEIIVSKTDLKGRIVYANDVFCRVAEMSTQTAIGQAHNIIRHPDMPRAIFKLLWDTLAKQQEIFAYVKNMSTSGKYYWVLAHVTPTLNKTGNVVGYHSNRRVPNRKALGIIEPLYAKLLAEEKKHSDSKKALAASSEMLSNFLKETGKPYDEFIWSVGE